MIHDTKQRIEEYKAMLPGIKERIVAVALMLAMSIAMVASTSYAWLTISRSPEAKGMSTTITGNGNLEIALAPSDGSLPLNSDGSSSDLLETNITWGNLVNLSDQRYGLDEIALRPALLSQYNLTSSPLYGATYGEDGRVSGTSEKYSFASFATAEDGTPYFIATTEDNPGYGVRAITSITYSNVAANAALNALDVRINNAYTAAWTEYDNLIRNQTLVSSAEGTPVYSVDALKALMQIYVQEKADGVLSDNPTPRDYSGVVTYMYRLMEAFLKTLEAEGKALTELANLQIYKTDKNLGTGYYKNFEEFYAACTETFTNGDGEKLHPAVSLVSLETFYEDYTIIKEIVGNQDPNAAEDQKSELRKLAEACDPDKVTNPPTVTWDQLEDFVEPLVVIGTAVIEQGGETVQVSKLANSKSALLNIISANSSANKATTTIKGGAIRDFEARMGAGLVNAQVSMSITVSVGISKTVHTWVQTDVDPLQQTTFQKNRQNIENMESDSAEDMGEAVANDTYGMAIDLWVRTNVSDVILTLEGSLVTTEVTATTINKDGVETTLYLMTVSTSTTSTVYGIKEGSVTTYYSYENGIMTEIGTSESMMSVLGYTFTATGSSVDVDGVTYTQYTMTQTQSTDTDVYKITVTEDETSVDYWYNAHTHEQLGTDTELRDQGASFTEQTVEMVTGYDGVNRVWEDLLDQIAQGKVLENNTTQGSGSCYVFYADPSEQTRILNLLEAFTVVFMDQNGNKLGTAKLDTAHAYSINGKTTVPLKLIAGTVYYDEEGNQQYGITALEKNEATWVSAVIYLDGTRLSNADVLAVGEIQGTLNIQFGSSVPLYSKDDLELGHQFWEMEAEVTYNGATSNSSSQPISLEYDENGHEVTVNVNVTGTQPKTMQGFFIRSISNTQGTKGQTVDFQYNEETGMWSATFKLTTPGTYIMRSVIVDGSEYHFKDGTEKPDADGNPGADSFPAVKINGLGIASVRIEGLNTGITMTADHSVRTEVTVGIDADASLMPTNVRALFRSKDGTEFTALLSNMGDSGLGTTLWKGTATITESGEYTLQYVVVDGVFFDLTDIFASQEDGGGQGQSTYIIYLGLTTQVWSQGVQQTDEDGNTFWDTSFLFQGAQNIDFQVKVFDGSGNEIRALEDVWLYYHSEGSILDQDGMYGQVYWNASTGYYEGTLELASGGIFQFDRVVTARNTNPNIINRAAFSPTIEAIVTTPPAYIGNNTTSYQFVPNGGATMSVELKDAQTASVWALITNGSDTYMVPMAKRENVGDSYLFTFDIPVVNDTQDGDWQMIALYLQGCANDNEEWVPKTTDPVTSGFVKLTAAEGGTWTVDGTGDTVDPTAYYVFDLTDTAVNGNDPVKAYVVQTVKVNGVETDSLKFDNVILGAVDTDGDGVISESEKLDYAVFMAEHTVTGTTWNITDWQGNSIQLDVGVTWQTTYNNDSSAYGGYTFTIGSYQDPDKVDFTGTNPTFTLADQKLQMAGTYSSKFVITIGGQAITVTGPNYAVYSKLPTVTINKVVQNPTTARYYLTSTPSILNVITGAFNNKIDDYNAVVYMYVAAQSGSLDQEQVTIKYPTVELGLSGIPTNHSGVTMVFGNASNSASGCTFTFEAGTTTASSTQTLGKRIGGGVDGVFNEGVLGIGSGVDTWPIFYPAGKQTVQTITVTYGGVTYTVTLSDAVTINNPLYPPYVQYAVNDSTYPGTVPSTVYSTNGETITLTLPDADDMTMTWTVDMQTNVNGEFAKTGVVNEENVYTTAGNWLTKYTHTQYTKTSTQYQAVGVETKWVNTHTITGWKIGNTVYAPGATVTVTGDTTITAVVTITEGTKTTTTRTATKYYVEFEQTGSTASNRNSTHSAFGSQVSEVTPYWTEETYN